MKLTSSFWMTSWLLHPSRMKYPISSHVPVIIVICPSCSYFKIYFVREQVCATSASMPRIQYSSKTLETKDKSTRSTDKCFHAIQTSCQIHMNKRHLDLMDTSFWISTPSHLTICASALESFLLRSPWSSFPNCHLTHQKANNETTTRPVPFWSQTKHVTSKTADLDVNQTTHSPKQLSMSTSVLKSENPNSSSSFAHHPSMSSDIGHRSQIPDSTHMSHSLRCRLCHSSF